MRRPLCFVSLLFVLLLTILRICSPPPKFSLGNLEGAECELIGTIVRKEIKEDYLSVYLKQVQITGIQPEQSAINNIGVICYISTNKDTDQSALKHLKIGSRVCLFGEAQSFLCAVNPGEFDVAQYYELSGFYFMIQNATPVSVSRRYCPYRECLFEIKSEAARILDEGMKKDSAGVMKAMLLGDKSTMNEEIKELYQQSGIAHILAISGLHISLLGMMLHFLLKQLGIKKVPCVLITLAFLISYGVMVGFVPSIMRAIGMYALTLIGSACRRSYDTLTAMSLLAVLILISQPEYIRFAGFQLSFGAILGISYLYPLIVSREDDRHSGKIKKSLLGSICVFVVTLPVMLYHYYEVSPLSILWNLAVIPFMTFLVIAGILFLLLGALCTAVPSEFVLYLQLLRTVPAHICDGILYFYRFLTSLNARIPMSVLRVGCPETIQIVVAAVFLVTAIFFGKMKKKTLFYASLLLYVLILILPLDAPLTIHFLDVGQGDGICIQSADGYSLLIDGGSSDKKKLWKNTMEPFLKYRGIRTVDYWFITHPDKDHFSGYAAFLDDELPSITVKNVVFSKAASKDETMMELIERSRSNGITVYLWSEKDEIKLDDLEVQCLFPSDSIETESNDMSLVLKLNYRELTAVFTGDAGEKWENIQMKSNMEKCDILKVSHHGSAKEANQEKFLQSISPRIAVISCAKENPYGHPHKETLSALESHADYVFRTDQSGYIGITYLFGKLRVVKKIK